MPIDSKSWKILNKMGKVLIKKFMPKKKKKKKKKDLEKKEKRNLQKKEKK